MILATKSIVGLCILGVRYPSGLKYPMVTLFLTFIFYSIDCLGPPCVAWVFLVFQPY